MDLLKVRLRLMDSGKEKLKETLMDLHLVIQKHWDFGLVILMVKLMD